MLVKCAPFYLRDFSAFVDLISFNIGNFSSSLSFILEFSGVLSIYLPEFLQGSLDSELNCSGYVSFSRESDLSSINLGSTAKTSEP